MCGPDTVKGWQLALMEVSLFGLVAYGCRSMSSHLSEMNALMYYWFCFTTLTGYWESVFISNYNDIAKYAAALVETKKSVWTSWFPITYVCPSYFSKIFYAEYGANADREYMSRRKGDFWARIVESSHALFCATFTTAALATLLVTGDMATANSIGLVAMAGQFMNSFLYMGQYCVACQNNSSPNFSCPDFPLGRWMCHRAFMWINILWLLCPAMICAQVIMSS